MENRHAPFAHRHPRQSLEGDLEVVRIPEATRARDGADGLPGGEKALLDGCDARLENGLMDGRVLEFAEPEIGESARNAEMCDNLFDGNVPASEGTRPCGFTVPGGVPAKLVACRGVPIVGAGACSLGPLPDVAQIRIRMGGSGEIDRHSPEHQTRVMQLASSVGLTNFYAVCGRASGVRLPRLGAWECGYLDFRR